MIFPQIKVFESLKDEIKEFLVVEVYLSAEGPRIRVSKIFREVKQATDWRDYLKSCSEFVRPSGEDSENVSTQTQCNISWHNHRKYL
jgi:hypothetical protein